MRNAMASTPASAKQPSVASPMPPSPLSLSAHELLASQRAVLADLSSASAAVLRNETNKKQDEASTLLRKLRASEKREAAAVAEAAELRAELEKAAAANKRIAWESRKKEQATAAAAYLEPQRTISDVFERFKGRFVKPDLWIEMAIAETGVGATVRRGANGKPELTWHPVEPVEATRAAREAAVD